MLLAPKIKKRKYNMICYIINLLVAKRQKISITRKEIIKIE